MFNWLNTQDNKESYVASDEFALRISKIKRRIASIRSNRGWDKKPTEVPQTQSKFLVDETAEGTEQRTETLRETKEVEMNALKANLLKGRK
jgi:hypothetical protein